MNIRYFEKALTLDYVNKYLQKKNIATNKYSEQDMLFKLYDLNWRLFYEDGRLRLNIRFELDDDCPIGIMMGSINRINLDRYIVKVFLEEEKTTNDESKNHPDTKSRLSIVFSFEPFCFTQSAFAKIYEFAVYAMTDAIDHHRKDYFRALEEAKSQNVNGGKIGFTAGKEKQTTKSEPVAMEKTRRIGFIK